MIPEGIKTAASDTRVTSGFADRHLQIGIDSLQQLINNGNTVRHLKY
jgi:AMP nucleosidase